MRVELLDIEVVDRRRLFARDAQAEQHLFVEQKRERGSRVLARIGARAAPNAKPPARRFVERDSDLCPLDGDHERLRSELRRRRIDLPFSAGAQ